MTPDEIVFCFFMVLLLFGGIFILYNQKLIKRNFYEMKKIKESLKLTISIYDSLEILRDTRFSYYVAEHEEDVGKCEADRLELFIKNMQK